MGTLLEVLQEVAGLRLIPGGPNQFRRSSGGQGSPLYLLDGIPVDEKHAFKASIRFTFSRLGNPVKSPGKRLDLRRQGMPAG